MTPIYESYKEYLPPRYAYATIAGLLKALPNHYLSGLQSVVLTNAAAIGRGKTQRAGGKKHVRNQCLGFYHPKAKGEQPWIEIVVDNVVASWFGQLPRFLRHIPLMRNCAFGSVLFHEVGHHLDRTIGPLDRGRESTADAWQKKLLRAYFRKRYWYLQPLIWVARPIWARLRRPPAPKRA